MTPAEAYDYCKEHGRNADLEKIIITDLGYAYGYLLYIIKGRWIEAENIISANPRYAYLYAANIIKDRWIEAENIIATDPRWAFYYALNVIKGKLPEHMHNMMLVHADHNSKKYLEFINKI